MKCTWLLESSPKNNSMSPIFLKIEEFATEVINFPLTGSYRNENEKICINYNLIYSVSGTTCTFMMGIMYMLRSWVCSGIVANYL